MTRGSAILASSCAIVIGALAIVTALPGATGDTTADRVLGQVDFNNTARNLVRANSIGGVVQVATPLLAVTIDRSSTPNHLYVADSGANRVLGWTDASGLANGAPADIVIGQPNLFSYFCFRDENGNTSASRLCAPQGVAVDAAGNVFVADSGNNRVVEFNAPFKSGVTAGMAASLVFGQAGSLATDFCNPTSVDALCGPAAVALDSGGNLYVADTTNARVLEYDNPLASSGGTPGVPGSPGDATADMVIGQADFVTSGCAPSTATSLCAPTGLAVDQSGNLWVADSKQNRVLEYDNPLALGGGTPGTPGAAGDATADLVLGQGGSFSTSLCDGSLQSPPVQPAAINADALCSPAAVAVDDIGNVYVADQANSRVLEYFSPLASGGGAPGTPGSAGDSTADLVFGQAGDFTATKCDGLNAIIPTDRQDAYFTASADSLCEPSGVAVDAAGDVFIADLLNYRVLKYDDPSASGGGTQGVPGSEGDTTADQVLGQVDFVKNAPNMVGASGFSFSNVTPAFPSGGVAIDRSSTPNHVYVVDTGNHRVLGWRDASGFTNGAAADIVIGQPDFNSYFCNHAPDLPPSSSDAGPDTLCRPSGAAVDSAGNLYVADTGNNRVLEFNSPFTSGRATGMAANVFFGQSNSNCDNTKITADSLCGPIGVAVDAAGNVYIADAGDNRVLQYDAPLATGGGTPGTPGSSGDTTADRVFGQCGSFSTFNCNFVNGTSADTLEAPTGIAIDAAGDVYIVDTKENRVLGYLNPMAPGGGTPGTPGSAGDTTADVVFGQGGDFTTAQCPASNAPSTADSLCHPIAATTDSAGDLYVSDGAPDVFRVLKYDAPFAVGGGTPGVPGSPGDTTADVVFGTCDSFGSTACYAEESGPDVLALPLGVATDSAGNLYIVDGGENRVLEYDQPGTSIPSPVPTSTPTPGAGGAVVSLQMKPHSLNFGAETFGLEGVTSRPLIVTISSPKGSRKNPGAAVTLGQISASPAEFSIEAGKSTCQVGTTLAPAAKCIVALTFTPGGLFERDGTLDVGSPGGFSFVTLRGEGVRGVIKVSPRKLKFGSVPTVNSSSAIVTLTNNNPVDLQVSAVSNDDPAEFTTSGNCIGKLPKNGGSCQITVTFNSRGHGRRTANLTITDDAQESPQIVKLTVRGK